MPKKISTGKRPPRPRRASVQIDDPLLARLERVAEDDRRPMANLVRKLLEERLEQITGTVEQRT